MNNSTDNTSPKDKIESFLNRACQAEARKDYVEAERLFGMALYCEGLSRPDVASAKDYTNRAGHLYGETTQSPE